MDSALPLPADAAVPRAAGWRSRVGAYVGLTKPRIIELLLVTTVPAMVLADRGVPSPWLVLTVLFGGTLRAAVPFCFVCDSPLAAAPCPVPPPRGTGRRRSCGPPRHIRRAQ